MLARARPDLLIIGGGIIGCSAAAFAAERGASVIVLEAEEIGAGASGRNSGAVQHPFDRVLAELHQATRRIYDELSAADPAAFDFPRAPVGLFLLTDDLDAARARVAELEAEHPELQPTVLDEDELRRLEPMVAGGWSAIRLDTGFPIPPEAATRTFAARARRAGAELRLDSRVAALGNGASVTLDDGSSLEAGAVLVAAGPWSSELLAASRGPAAIRPTYGVTLQIDLVDGPRGVLEEGAVHTVHRQVQGEDAGVVTFSLVNVRGTSTIGSTFLSAKPDPAAMAPRLLENAARFVPAVAGSRIVQSRVCARPQSPDGRPFIGPLPGRRDTYVAAGHGPWGMSTGPASAALVVDAILDGAAVPAALRADRAI
jgi:glycine/D-amino acid oxidase-like deaminating enzyme